MQSRDQSVRVRLAGKVVAGLPAASTFTSIEDASRFFQAGSLGYSVTRDVHKLHGLHLQTDGWHVQPLELENVSSSFFEDSHRFPPGSAVFDSALIMRNLSHRWHAAGDLPCVPTPANLI
jgi:hypothetical protein